MEQLESVYRQKFKIISTEMETEGRKKEDKERREGGKEEALSGTFLQAFVIPELPPIS